MLLLVSLYFLLYLAPHALASVGAGPHQIMYMWYAYRLDIEAFGKRDDSLAPLCPGTFKDGTCKFDEFVEYLDRKQIDGGLKSGVGDELWPDPITTQDKLRTFKSGGKDWVPNPDQSKLFKAGTMTAAPPQLKDILGALTDKIQAARTKIGDDKIPGEALDKIRTSITATHERRLQENGEGYIKAINAWLKKNKKPNHYTVETHELTGLDGSKYKDVDFIETMKKHSEFSIHYSEFQEFLSNVDTKVRRDLKDVVMHYNAAQGTFDVSSRVHSGPSC